MAEENQNMDEAAAAEWAAMLESEETPAGGGEAAAPAGAAPAAAGAMKADDGRVLNQDEIDLLLGFDSKEAESDNNTGIKAILGKSLMAYEKMPMIEVVFDRLVRFLSTSLRTFTSDNVDVSIDSITSLRFDDYLNSIPLPALLVVYRAVEWENFGLVTVDSSLIYSMVDVLLGGRRSSRPIRIEGRPYTTIEQDIVKNMVDIILTEMSTAFDPISPVTFQHERLENNPRFATITRPNNAALLVRLRVDIEDRGGIIEILLPHTTLEPIRDLLTQIFMGEKFGHDSVWEQHLAREMKYTDVNLDVVLDERSVNIGEILRLKVGSTILFDRPSNGNVTLKCGDVALTHCKLGRVGNKIAVSLTESISSQKMKEAL